MNNLVRKNKTYKLDNLPQVSSFGFSYQGRIGFTGSIVKRRLNGGGPFWHYGFIYGLDANFNPLVIENNDNGVECVTWRDFMAEATSFDLAYCEKDPLKRIEIMARAVERSNEEYIIHDNNCEHFVNYCVYNERVSAQVDILKRFADSILALAETNYVLQKDDIYKELLEEYNTLRVDYGIKRNNAPLQKMIEKRLAK